MSSDAGGAPPAASLPFRSFAELILDRGVSEPDAVLVADRERRLTCAEFAGLAFRLARALEREGLERGDRVAILATISPEALAVRCAAALLGCTTMFCPDKGSDAGLRALLASIRADALIVFPETATAAAGAIGSGSIASVMSLGAAPTIDVDLLAVADTMAADPVPSRARGGDLGVLVSSGGTTGKSKASRRSFAAYGRMIDVGRTRDRRLLVCMPVAYVSQVLADQVLVGGGTVVLCERFEPGTVLEMIERERITHVGLVEPALVELIDHPSLARRDLSSLVALSHIGADAPANLRRKLLERVGPVLAHPYGASEAGILSILAAPEYDLSHPELLATAGRVLPGVELHIQHPDGSEVPPGSEGAIVIRSPAAADGYALDPERSGFRGGGYHTGDLGLLDADGYLHVRGRAADAREIDDSIVMPLDVANAICAHPDVRYAVAVPAGRGFSSIVTLAPGSGAGDQALREFIRDQYGDRLVPDAVLVADRMPTTEQGKPDRVAIAAAIAAASNS
jgi:fatty-acyl-CoA synthase